MNIRLQEWAHNTKGEVKSWRLEIEQGGIVVRVILNKKDLQGLVHVVTNWPGKEE